MASRSKSKPKSPPSALQLPSKLSRSTPFLLLLVLAKRATGQYIPPQAVDLRRAFGFEKDETGEGWVRSVGERKRGLMMGRDDDSDDTQSSTSRSLYLVSSSDFCLFGPPSPSSNISETGGNVVSWCTDSRHGTRRIPDGTLNGVTYVKAPGWVQVSGTGHFTQINIAAGDSGGQFDSGDNTPDGAVLYTTDDNQAADTWITMISADTFCVRACSDPTYCPLEYDQMGCYFYTSNGVGWDGVYQDCEGDNGDPPGVVDGTTYTQGHNPTPTPSTPPVSNCNAGSSVVTGQFATAFSDEPSQSGSAGASGDASSDSGSETGGYTSWVPVQTCVPCTDTAAASESGSAGASFGGESSSAAATGESSAAGASSATGSSSAQGASSGSSAASASASGSGAASGGENGATEQVGMTQLSAASVAAVQISSSSSVDAATYSGALSSSGASASSWSSDESSTITSASASATGTSAAEGGENGGDALSARWLAKKDEETTTSDGKCCYTTWTPSVIGESAQETGTLSSGSSGSSKASGSSSIALSGAKTAGSLSTAAAKSIASGISSVKASGSLSAEDSTASGNTSGNSTNDTSGALRRLEITGIEGGFGKLLWAAGDTMMGMVAGGAMIM
ncbi:hypothetical protein IAR50_002587 [Cryptococcus sp. DSM 104548]